MIVIGADTHKATHTCAAVTAGIGELLGSRTVPARKEGFGALLKWARGLDAERTWAIEDCRHVSGGLERFLIARGERVIRVAPKLPGLSDEVCVVVVIDLVAGCRAGRDGSPVGASVLASTVSGPERTHHYEHHAVEGASRGGRRQRA